jgi:hypothetical protein
VHADDAAGVAASGAGLLAEARGEGGVEQRELVAVEHLVAVDVGELDLSRGDEVQVGVHVVEVLIELGQLAGAEEAVVVGDDGGPPLLEAGLVVHVDEEVDEAALHAGTHATQQVEAGAGELDAAVEINHAQLGAKVPVSLGLEVELARGAPAAHLGVVGVVLAVRHVLVRDVGDGGNEVEELLLNVRALLAELGDALLVGGDLRLGGLGLVLLAVLHEKADLLGHGVAVGLELLDLGDDGAALLVELEELLAVPVRVLAGLAGLVHDVGVLADELDVEHVLSLLLRCDGSDPRFGAATLQVYTVSCKNTQMLQEAGMQAISDFFTWLFGTKMGVIVLIIGGILICLLIAFLMERKTKTMYYNHEKSDDDWSLFDDDDEE